MHCWRCVASGRIVVAILVMRDELADLVGGQGPAEAAADQAGDGGRVAGAVDPADHAGRRARLVAMTSQAAGDKQEPPAEQPPAPAVAPEAALNPLQRLIQRRMRERGWSYGEVARRGGLPRSTVYTSCRRGT